MTTLYYNTPLIFLVHNLKVVFHAKLFTNESFQGQKACNQVKHCNKTQVSNVLFSLKWLYLTLKMRLVFPIVLPVKMCEMFPVKCKPGINLDTVFFVWQPANVIYVTGQRAVSLLLEKGWRGCPGEKKSSPNSQDGILVVITWQSCVCV